MLLAIDIGNTQIHVGLFKGKRLLGEWRLPADVSWSQAHYLGKLKKLNAKIKGADHCVIASVVPVLTRLFQKIAIPLTGQLPIIVNARNTGGLKLQVPNPKEVGADRIVNALAAYELYGAPAMVVDFGTAITIDLVTAKKEYIGGVIAPGMKLVAKALHLGTALLPEIELSKPRHIHGTNTITCMQSGIFYSAVGLAETVITRLKKELRWRHPKIILTGGQAALIGSALPKSYFIDPYLTLKGLQIISNK